MKKPILAIFLLTFIVGCENNKGQYRHDKKHHETIQKMTK